MDERWGWKELHQNMKWNTLLVVHPCNFLIPFVQAKLPKCTLVPCKMWVTYLTEQLFSLAFVNCRSNKTILFKKKFGSIMCMQLVEFVSIQMLT
jgi:hypothetical protein